MEQKQEQENAINLEEVQKWYLEAEKIVRVLANLFNSPMIHSVNQLRYAGHHVLKSQINLKNSDIAHSNLVEAFKHCKRAIYDALDFYVYKLNDWHRTLMPYLSGENTEKLEQKLREHIQNIQEARLYSGERIDYYTKVQEKLLDGLRLVKDINDIQRKTGITKELLRDKKEIIKENFILNENQGRLEKYINILQKNEQYLKNKFETKGNRILTFLSILVAICLAISIPLGLTIGNFWITSKHEVKLNSQVLCVKPPKNIETSKNLKSNKNILNHSKKLKNSKSLKTNKKVIDLSKKPESSKNLQPQ